MILDNLSTGRREFTADRIFYEGDISDGVLIDKVFAEHPDIHAVVHCAALIIVPDSVADPIGYYQANVGKSLDMVQHLIRSGCTRMIFSSSAAIYSPGADLSVSEDSPTGPLSPYARTKTMLRADVRRHRRRGAHQDHVAARTSTRSAPTPSCVPGCRSASPPTRSASWCSR